MVDLPNVAQACADVMKAAGFRRVAVVRETASWDQAFLSTSNTHILIRCAAEANEADLRALETISALSFSGRYLVEHIDQEFSFIGAQGAEPFNELHEVQAALKRLGFAHIRTRLPERGRQITLANVGLVPDSNKTSDDRPISGVAQAVSHECPPSMMDTPAKDIYLCTLIGCTRVYWRRLRTNLQHRKRHASNRSRVIRWLGPMT